MKKIFFLSFLLTAISLSIGFAQDPLIMNIPANDQIELDYPEDETYAAHIKNKSFNGLSIAVVDNNTDEFVRGFGLGKKGKAEVIVEGNSKLVIKNENNSNAKVKIQLKEKGFPVTSTTRKYVSFTLRNNSAKSIPLIIPTVMNPNLSPFSNSGVDLKMGQEIIFKHKGKKYTLLVVDDSIEQDAVIEVSSLLKAKKKELGLK